MVKVGCRMAFAKVCKMTVPFENGRYGVRFAQTADDIAACQALRHQCFLGADGIEADRFDDGSLHLMIANEAGLVCTARIILLRSFDDISHSYAAQSYDFKGLFGDAPILEFGRFCIRPGADDPDVLRLAWGALAQLVDAHNAAYIIGCASFAGVDASAYTAGFGLLARRYLGAVAVPTIADDAFDLVDAGLPAGGAQIPPLLRSYLAMGGWVGQRAVVDPVMQTIHVFTALEIAKIPAARARALRRMIA